MVRSCRLQCACSGDFRLADPPRTEVVSLSCSPIRRPTVAPPVSLRSCPEDREQALVLPNPTRVFPLLKSNRPTQQFISGARHDEPIRRWLTRRSRQVVVVLQPTKCVENGGGDLRLSAPVLGLALGWWTAPDHSALHHRDVVPAIDSAVRLIDSSGILPAIQNDEQYLAQPRQPCPKNVVGSGQKRTEGLNRHSLPCVKSRTRECASAMMISTAIFCLPIIAPGLDRRPGSLNYFL